jgi:hypothetical protein
VIRFALPVWGHSLGGENRPARFALRLKAWRFASACAGASWWAGFELARAIRPVHALCAREFNAWPFTPSGSPRVDYNVAPFFHANRVRVIPYGIHDRLA